MAAQTDATDDAQPTLGIETIDIDVYSTLSGREVRASSNSHHRQACNELRGGDDGVFERVPVFTQDELKDPEATSKFHGGSRLGVSDGDVFELVFEGEREFYRIDGEQLVKIDRPDYTIVDAEWF